MATSHKEPIGGGKEGEVEVEFSDDGIYSNEAREDVDEFNDAELLMRKVANDGSKGFVMFDTRRSYVTKLRPITQFNVLIWRNFSPYYCVLHALSKLW